MAKPVIQVIGSLNMDLVSTTRRMPGPGETITASSFATGFGGKGANQAVACARVAQSQPGEAPVDVQMIGCVGDDVYGASFKSHLEKDGININSVRTVQGTSTGTAVIIVEESSGENRILINPGANYSLKPGDVPVNAHGGYSILQLEVPLETVVSYLVQANKKGINVIFNPAPAVELPEEVFKGLRYLIVNESEAALLSESSEEQVQTSPDETAAKFFSKGVDTVIITLGAKGVYWNNAAKSKAGQPGETIPSRKVEVIDTTAAGDTFVGAFAVHLALKDNGVRNAIDYANYAASLSVQKSGAQSSIPYGVRLE